jgi:hypothetical protein
MDAAADCAFTCHLLSLLPTAIADLGVRLAAR